MLNTESGHTRFPSAFGECEEREMKKRRFGVCNPHIGNGNNKIKCSILVFLRFTVLRKFSMDRSWWHGRVLLLSRFSESLHCAIQHFCALERRRRKCPTFTCDYNNFFFWRMELVAFHVFDSNPFHYRRALTTWIPECH